MPSVFCQCITERITGDAFGYDIAALSVADFFNGIKIEC